MGDNKNTEIVNKINKELTKGYVGLRAYSKKDIKMRHKNLQIPKKKTGGRNNHGRITTFHIGGGHKQSIRQVDYKRNWYGAEAQVINIQKRPGRRGNIALIKFLNDNTYKYIIQPENLEQGHIISAGENVPLQIGNALPLRNIPEGTYIHNINKLYARAPGAYGILLKTQENKTILKAGRNRWLGVRPTVRGVAMNPIDHPHGGGEGKASGGRPSATPWGRPTKGPKTRRKG